MEKRKLTFRLILLVVLPAAFGELLSNIFNSYVPIFLQAGNPEFDVQKVVLTFGFGAGAMLVGFWMTIDNLLSPIIQPWVGAWSDRTRSRFGRRIPFVLWSLPLIVIGYVLIPLIPQWIPAEANGQIGKMVGLFVAFAVCCFLFYLGYQPARAILQALRQESVPVESRSKIEAWYFFLMNILTVLGVTLGGQLYKVYGPLLFWVVLSLYVIAVLCMVMFYKEPQEMVESAADQEQSTLKQLFAIFKGLEKPVFRSLIAFLVSTGIYALSLSIFINFASSWGVNMLGLDEAKAAGLMTYVLLPSMVVALPAGYLGGTKFGRKNVYLIGLVLTFVGAALLAVVPSIYIAGLVIFGMGMACVLSTQLPLASELAGKERALGAIVGIYNFAYMIGFLLGANLMGVIIELTSYASVFVVGSIMALAALILALFIKPGAVVQEAK